jgi:hypothetical protein
LLNVLVHIANKIGLQKNEAYSTVRIGKHLSDSFPIQNGLKQGDAKKIEVLTSEQRQGVPAGFSRTNEN